MVKAIDDLAAYEEFKTEVLPALRKDLAAGLSAQEIYQKYQSYAAARGVTIALTAKEEGVALGAIKEMLDRSVGKPTERRETTHRLAQVPDNEVDALLHSKLEALQAEVVEEDGE